MASSILPTTTTLTDTFCIPGFSGPAVNTDNYVANLPALELLTSYVRKSFGVPLTYLIKVLKGVYRILVNMSQPSHMSTLTMIEQNRVACAGLYICSRVYECMCIGCV